MKISYVLICFFSSMVMAQAQPVVRAERLIGSVNSPVAMASDGNGNLYVCEQPGVIRKVVNGAIQPIPFLDLRNRVIKQMNVYSERGLLSLAFHPDFKHNGKVYVYYSTSSKKKGSNHKSVISEFKLGNDGVSMRLNSERILLEMEQPESNHNGGQLAFDAEGYLYIGSGDGGGANDEHSKQGNGQDLETLLGKILRIDVNTTDGYKIPRSNPFVNKPGKDEIWAYGLRNPWKFSFDESGSRLFCADVGQDTWEEIDLIEKGGNYGWRIMEGNHCFNSWGKCDQKGLKMPIAAYNHSVGRCIIGGYLYHGKNTAFKGRYIFGDWTGKVFMLTPSGNQWTMQELLVQGIEGRFSINSFGEDDQGELYLLGQKGIGPDEPASIWKLSFEMR